MYKIDPQDLHHVWPEVRKGLTQVRAKCVSDWIEEDIYAALRQGSALLYIDLPAFVVVNVIPSYSGKKELFVWAAYGEGIDPGSEYNPEVDSIAEGLECQHVTFFSSRRGWAKNRLGYEEVHTLYRKTLPWAERQPVQPHK
jgi:hypothetical protein